MGHHSPFPQKNFSEETIERFLPGRPSTSATNAGGALKEFREATAARRRPWKFGAPDMFLFSDVGFIEKSQGKM